MIRAVAHLSDGGMAILLGITEPNVERLKEGQPIEINLGELLVEAMRGAEPARGGLRLFISYQPTHVAVVQEWLDAGLPLDADMLEEAAKIDDTP